MNRIIQKTTILIASVFSILALGVLISVAIPPSLIAAQSTGDRLPTRTPAATTTPTSPAPTPSAVPPSVTPRLVWEGRLVSNTLGVTEGNGSIFRVMVKGLSGVPIEVRLDDKVLVATSGSKSEYGPFMAEFAPLPAGTWTVSVPSLDASLAVTADSYNLAIIEFSQTAVVLPATATAQSPAAAPSNTPIPPPTNTRTPTQTATSLPTATPSPAPTPITRWLGAVAAREALPNSPSVLVVSVSDVQGVSIQLRPAEGESGGERQCVTGQNTAEFDLCTFEAVQPGSYTVSPEGLGVSLPLTVSNNEKVLVVFDIEVLPSGVTGWQAAINRNTNGSTPLNQQAGRIVVRIDGRHGQVVALHSVRGTEQLCEISFNSLLNDLACEFSGLRPGVYRVNVLHTGVGQSLFIDGAGLADLTFSPGATAVASELNALPTVGQGANPRLPTPTATATTTARPPTATATRRPATATATATSTPTPTPAFAWQGRIVDQVDGVAGTIAVRAAGLEGHPVVIRSGPWQTAPQLTGSKPELGEYATEFGGLAQGEYIVELVDLAELKVELAGDQFILVEFRYDLVR